MMQILQITIPNQSLNLVNRLILRLTAMELVPGVLEGLAYPAINFHGFVEWRIVLTYSTRHNFTCLPSPLNGDFIIWLSSRRIKYQNLLIGLNVMSLMVILKYFKRYSCLFISIRTNPDEVIDIRTEPISESENYQKILPMWFYPLILDEH